MPNRLPLAGITIAEHAEASTSEVTLRAIALAGRIAADLGATVVRVVPGAGDPLAGEGPASGFASRFLNAGKLIARTAPEAADAMLVDARAAGSATAARAPIRVVVAHGVPEAFGLDDRDVTDTTILALSGLLDLIGAPADAPVPLGGHQACYVAGLAAFSGLMAALVSGGPETVRISALEACLWSNWKSFAERLYLGRTPTRQGRLAEWQALPCADGFAAFIYLEKDWPAVCRMIGDPRLSEPPLNSQAGRRADMAAVFDIVAPWYRKRTRAEIYRAARSKGLPIAPVLAVDEVIADQQFAAQRFFAPPADGGAGTAERTPTIPVVWNGERFPPRPAAGLPREGTAGAAHASAGAAAGEALSGGTIKSAKPLAGCRVLDLGIITAGASTSAILADLGADVIKIESSSYIDPFRAWDRGLGAPDWWNRSRFFQFTNRGKRGVAIDLKHADGRALFLDLVAKSDVVVENFRRGVLERLGLGWAALSDRNPRLVLCSVTSQGESGPEAGAATYGSTLEATSGLADLTRNAAGEPLISGILLNYPDQIVSIYAAGIVALAVREQRRTGRGARLDISQRELASFLIGEHILSASGGAARGEGERRAAASLGKGSDGRWLLQAGARSVPVRDAMDLLEAVQRGEAAGAFCRAPDGSYAKGSPFVLASQPLRIERPAPDLGGDNADVLASVLGLGTDEIGALAKAGIIGTRPRD